LNLISQTAEYALRAIVCLAGNSGKSLTSQEIAEMAHVPAGYMSKVLQALGRAGLVLSQRGLNGGFSLTRPSADMTVLDVVNAVDPIKRIHTCPLGLKQHGEKLCPLHRQLDEAAAQIETSFRETNIADLLVSDSGITPLCET
jgi:Rrf2 family protein